jgi:hypothetical protein
MWVELSGMMPQNSEFEGPSVIVKVLPQSVWLKVKKVPL